MQFNIIFKTIFEYIHKKFRFVHTNTFYKYRKKLRASPRVHLVIVILFFLISLSLPFVNSVQLYIYLLNCNRSSSLQSILFSSFFFFRKNYLLLLYATSVRPSVRPSVCPSVRPSVRPSVCPSVRPSVRPSVCGNNFFSR